MQRSCDERVREEMVTGKTLRAAIDTGYSRAFTAIFDGHVTSFLTGLVLYQFGSSGVQGFALTLMIGWSQISLARSSSLT